jgi:hypothetical protein
VTTFASINPEEIARCDSGAGEGTNQVGYCGKQNRLTGTQNLGRNDGSNGVRGVVEAVDEFEHQRDQDEYENQRQAHRAPLQEFFRAIA